MYWNSTRMSLCVFSDINNTSRSQTIPGNETEDLQDAMYSMYECFHSQLNIQDKAKEVFGSPLRIFSFIVCCLSLLANTASILTITFMSQSKFMHLKLIISLCLSDGLISLSIIFDDVLFILSSWGSCARLCTRLLLDMALLATLLNLLAMSLDHYMAIIKPIYYRQLMTKFQMNCMIIGLWAISLGAVVIEVFTGVALQDKSTDSTCRAIEAGPDNLEIFIVGFVFVVLSGIMIVYTVIYRRVSMAMSDLEVTRCQKDSGSFKALVTSLLFIATFALFWTPHGIFQIYLHVLSKSYKEYVTDNVERLTFVNDILFIILQLNSLADPIIYAFRLPNVRKSFEAMLKCQRRQTMKRESLTLIRRVTRERCSSTCKERLMECAVHVENNDVEINGKIAQV